MTISLFALALGGCAVSSGGLSSSQSSPQQTASKVDRGPVAMPDQSADLALASAADKFSKPNEGSLGVAEPGAAFDAVDAEFRQAYAEASQNFVPAGTTHAELKPYVGRWKLQPKNSREKLRQLGSSLGLSESCELVLEDARRDYGYKASGNSACPTSLFMLDSWVAFDDRLVLRDHMGDDIVKLRSDGRGVWVGVNKEGNMLVLKKS
ncbi:AprI/Inh family metalloprotease inhibitor [uncultured Cohaesibacter sp.]|uniref:AprI/Inh family metalloprotease inhibitor n=1 Tax=uncultured Cohaesibacter sp. TaxID=1002546 RepID=UPI002AABEEB5|nr:AprI/Inh family metalloprotease inhibitor [uncultured Cohaesibacter sp.]